MENAMNQTTIVESKEKDQTPTPKVVSKKPMSVAAKLALERMQKLKEIEEQRLREEEELRRQEEELRKKEEEEKLQLEMERERKRKLRLEKKEKWKKEGKLLSPKDRAQQQKNMNFITQLRNQGIIPSINGDQENNGKNSKKSRVVFDKKKKKTFISEVEENDLAKKDVNDNIEIVEELKEKIEEPPDDWEEAFGDVDNKVKKNQNTQEFRIKEAQRKNDVNVQVNAPNQNQNDNNISNQQKISQISDYRSPICCILGHVDTGKTKLLDKIRRTNVQDKEAGGITQQIGATFFPPSTLKNQALKIDANVDVKVPGLLIIDTPGHESFNNLRARGSSLCDIAVLVIDIMHGIEPQTRESINLLKARKCPFVVALNKIDRLYDWKVSNWEPIRNTLAKQPEDTKQEFETRCQHNLLKLKEEGLNCELYWKNNDIRHTISVVPTSAITGEGISDLLYLIITLTQNVMSKAISYKHELQCTILEVKNIEGMGTTIDVILVNGKLREGETMVVCGMNGPIVTNIRALLTPQPLKELRIKGEYIHHKEIRAAIGVKISAQGLEDAIAGTSVLIAKCDDDIDALKDEVMNDMTDIFKSVDRSGSGVYVMASTLGSLEALLQFLKDSNIPVFAVNIGTVHKSDIKKASVMREKGHPEMSCVLAFDVRVDVEAEKEAKVLGVQIISADIIYHLFDAFTKYIQEFKEEKKKEKSSDAVFPCILSILPQYIFNKKDPIVVGVKVEDGILKVGTPLVIPDKDFLRIGRVSSLEHNKKIITKATKGMEICIKTMGEPNVMYGRHFDSANKIYSKITRESIDCLKEHFRDELSRDDWKLVIQLKKIFDVL